MKAANSAVEVSRGERFPFGANWAAFLTQLDERDIEDSKVALRQMLGMQHLEGRTFLDAGCGSGLHSLAAFNLGARVVSFDFDPESVQCTLRLQKHFGADPQRWRVVEGSVLDKEFLNTLGTFDVVYSWGVLHHTGLMWSAIDNVTRCVSQDGTLFVAIYNDQGWLSRYWKAVKVLYNYNPLLRWSLIAAHSPYLIAGRMMSHALKGRPGPGRGMSYWTDMKDWLGGLPFEVAKPNDVARYLEGRGFLLRKVKTCGSRSGCNEFVFRKASVLSCGTTAA